MSGESYLAAAITASVAVILWIASRIVEMVIDRNKLIKEKEKFVRALFAEIDFNTSDMEEFVANPIPLNAVVHKVKTVEGFIPHITDARHTEIYKSNISVINFAGDAYIREVVYFYGLLERIKGQIDGVYLPSFIKISGQGRANVINRIYDDSFSCAEAGRDILWQMTAEYPSYRLERKKRLAPDDKSDANLKNRMEKFTLDLDRIRATHKNAS
jgi:hypothetical protein